MKKKTTEEFKKEIFNLVGNEYFIIGEYTGNKNNIKFKHNKCGKIFEMEPIHFLYRGDRCSCESNYKELSELEVKELIEKSFDGNFQLISNYKNKNDKIKIKHKKCNNILEISLKDFLKKAYPCNCLKQEYKNKKFQDKIGNEYELISNYKDSKTKVKIKHLKCGNEFEIFPESFLKNCKCKYCNEKSKIKIEKEIPNKLEEYKNKIKEIYGNEYEILSDSLNKLSDKILIKHSCGYIYESQARNLLNDHGCKLCGYKNTRKSKIGKKSEKIKNSKLKSEKFYSRLNPDMVNQFKIISEYSGMKYPIKIKCLECGNEFETSPNSMIIGSVKCLNCKKLDEDIKLENNDSRKFKIYKYESYKNPGKVYVGQTKQSLIERSGKDGHKYLDKKSNGQYTHPKFAAAINKFGWDSFSCEIIGFSDSAEMADELEKKFILEYDSVNNGYNVLSGGQSERPDEGKSVFQIDIKSGKIIGKFESAAEAGKSIGSSPDRIRKCCRGETKSSAGYFWIYEEEYNKKYGENNLIEIPKDSRIRPVVQLDYYTGEVIERFKSISEASKIADISSSRIANCCNHKPRVLSAGGFKWEFL